MQLEVIQYEFCWEIFNYSPAHFNALSWSARYSIVEQRCLLSSTKVGRDIAWLAEEP
jgi:hypothetical protein